MSEESDLVERLRERAGMYEQVTAALVLEAAAEIERLRVALKKISKGRGEEIRVITALNGSATIAAPRPFSAPELREIASTALDPLPPPPREGEA